MQIQGARFAERINIERHYLPSGQVRACPTTWYMVTTRICAVQGGAKRFESDME